MSSPLGVKTEKNRTKIRRNISYLSTGRFLICHPRGKPIFKRLQLLNHRSWWLPEGGEDESVGPPCCTLDYAHHVALVNKNSIHKESPPTALPAIT